MSFNFGVSNTGSGGSGFSFGGNTGGFSLAKQTTAPTTTTVSGGLFSSSGGGGGGGGGGFSFGGAAIQQQTASAGSGFSFGTAAATPKPAFSFTPAATSSQQASTGFSFAPATVPAQQPSSGFSFAGAGGGFGSNPTSTSSSFGGGFSLNKQATAPSIPAFGLGSTGTGGSLTGGSKPISLGTAATPKNAPIGGLGGGFTFSTPSTVTNNNAGGFKLGSFAAPPAQNPSQSTTNTAAPLGTTFSLATPQSTVSAGGFSLTAPSNTQTTNPALSGFGLGPNKISAAPTSTAAPTSFGFGSGTTAVTSAPAPSTGGFSFGGNTSATPLSTPATTSGTPSSLSSGFKLGTGTSLFPSSTTSSQSVTSTSSVAAPSLTGSASTPSLKLPTIGITTVTTAATAPTSSTSTSTPSMRYKDLENKVNTWMGELEQQEKLFLTQATHVNAWNKLLIENADKITTLNDEFENVSLNQKRLNEELDLVKMQHNELEELLKPLEENMKQQMSSLSSSMHTHHADIERERTYNLAENIDGQLKTMVQDLREVVEHINSTSTPGNENNPIMQIGKILSAHMDSLQWLDSNSGSLQLKVQELSKQVDKMKKEHESKFRLAFN